MNMVWLILAATAATTPATSPATAPATAPATELETLAAGPAGTWVLVDYAVDIGIIIVGAGMLLCVLRLLRGPHLADRALAMDTLATHLIVLVILLTMRGGSLLLFDGVLVLALLGFLTTVVFAQYILRRHVRPAAAPAPPPDQPPLEGDAR